MNVEKNCCSLVRSIEKCISGVISSYAYNEVIYSYGEDSLGFIKEIAENQDTTKEKRGKTAEKMLKYRDNQNCRRILDAFQI